MSLPRRQGPNLAGGSHAPPLQRGSTPGRCPRQGKGRHQGQGEVALSTLSVAHLIHALAPGGAEAVLVDLARVAPKAGLRLTVVSLMRFTDRRYVLELQSLGADVHTLGLDSRWDPRGVSRTLSLLAKVWPDVVHTHLKHADLLGAVAARRLGLPLVSTLHMIENNPDTRARYKRWLAGSARSAVAARTIAVSTAQRRWYLETFGGCAERVVTVPNGVADPGPPCPAARARLRAELGLPPDVLLVLNVGILRPGKGHADLIDATARLRGDGSVRVLLAGDGPLRAELGRRAAAAGLGPERLRFLGFRDDVPALMAAADVVVHPSHFEALPTVLIQAMAAGRPIIACPVGGVEDVVTAAEAVLVPVGDVAAVADAITGLAADPARRSELGRAGRRRYDERFRADVWAGRLRLLYEEVLGSCQHAG